LKGFEIMMSEERAKEVAFNLVKRFDEESLNNFETLWSDLSTGPDADRVPSYRHGAGIELPHEFWSLIIIPLVGAIAKKAVDLSVDSIVEWIKKRRGGVGKPEDAVIARATVDAIQH
jgi:hypothetical protein